MAQPLRRLGTVAANERLADLVGEGCLMLGALLGLGVGNAISLNSLANGIYVMKITSAEGKVMTQKIVK